MVSLRNMFRFCVLAILWAGTVHHAVYAGHEDSTHASVASVEHFIASDAFERAENEALRMIEYAHLDAQVDPNDMVALGNLLMRASRFSLAKDAFNVASPIFSESGNLLAAAKTLYRLAVSNRHLSQYPDALQHLQRALSIAHILDESPLEASLHLELGKLHSDNNKLEQALRAFNTALQDFKDQNNHAKTAESLLHIGKVFVQRKQTTKARTLFNDALLLLNNQEDDLIKGALLTQLAVIELNSNNNEKALELLIDAQVLNGSVWYSPDALETQAWLGEALCRNDRVDEGLETLSRVLDYAEDTQQARLSNHTRLALSRSLINAQRFDDALIYAKAGTISARKQHNVAEQIAFLNLQLSAYVSLGKFKMALDIQSVIQQLKELLRDSRNQEAISVLQAEIALTRQASELQKLEKSSDLALAMAEQKNLRTTLFWSTLLAGLLTLFLIWSRFKQRQQTVALRREVREQTTTLEMKNSELEQAYKTLEEFSLRDALTGLYNRHYLESQLPAEIKRSQNGKETFAQNSDLLCLLIDIDHFKKINDNHGHAAGDTVLKAFAQRLQQVFRHTDLIIRWGGEEFLVVCRGATRYELPEIAERCRQIVSQTPFDIGNDTLLTVSCSIGFSLLPPSNEKYFEQRWEATFSVVDYCLYAAKLSGRNGWVGLIETSDKKPDETSTPLGKKFGFGDVTLATSFNNIAAITWPNDDEEEQHV
ncbi:diguanylate cyclase [Alteromonas sp. A079]|uniref:tetratricopeptide repeat-containing diguanylate cyclase n=1 Tax=Alteromonas sp. A079 TaxID=3410268 RepID=UPI003BA16F56